MLLPDAPNTIAYRFSSLAHKYTSRYRLPCSIVVAVSSLTAGHSSEVKKSITITCRVSSWYQVTLILAPAITALSAMSTVPRMVFSSLSLSA